MSGIPENMTVYYVVLLKKGPAWSAEQSPAQQALQQAHQAHLTGLREAGHLVAVGPILDDSDVGGLSIFKTGSLEQAVELSRADPAVQAQRFVIEAHPWLTFKGILP